MIESSTPSEVVFIWGAITGMVASVVVFLAGAVWSDKHDDRCSHRWLPWSDPDSNGNQLRRCKKCNLQDASKGD